MDASMYPLIIAGLAMLLDLVTGIAKAAKNKKMSSSKMREGLWHKAGFVGLIALMELLEVSATFMELPFDIPAVMATCVFIVMTEAVSILENLCELNDAIADSPIGRVLAQYPKTMEDGSHAKHE